MYIKRLLSTIKKPMKEVSCEVYCKCSEEIKKIVKDLKLNMIKLNITKDDEKKEIKQNKESCD
jgi:hypothetical protein